jgi:hypothetical protein
MQSKRTRVIAALSALLFLLALFGAAIWHMSVSQNWVRACHRDGTTVKQAGTSDTDFESGKTNYFCVAPDGLVLSRHTESLLP